MAAPFALVFCLGLALAGAAAITPATTVVVDLSSGPQPPLQTVLAVQVCAGLFNRRRDNASSLPAVYVLLHPEDAPWLAVLDPALPSPPPTTPADTFVAQCLASPAVAGRVNYSLATQLAVVPLLLTAAGVLDAVPLEDGSPLVPAGQAPPPLVFDALSTWSGLTPADATADAFQRWGNATSSLAWMNPGYNATANPLAPPLTGVPDLSLADWVVAARLFNIYLPLGCVPLTHDHDVLDAIAAAAPWPQPVTVWGYDDTVPLFGGDVFEAETACTSARNQGQAATAGVSNLAFMARAPRVASPLAQPPLPAVAYNASLTYVAFLVGDGDNVAYIKGTRFAWFQERLAACGVGSSGGQGNRSADCSYPLSWTISPHLLDAAPDVLRWYYGGAARTGVDYFLLPPSGHLYAYPGLMPSAVQAAFAAATEQDAYLLNCSGTVEWEPAGTWAAAAAGYMPRYSARGTVRALFAVNVPYMVPLVELFPLGDDGPAVLNVAGGNGSHPVWLFRPQEWRGTSGGALLPPFMLTPAQFAARLNAMPRGTVTHIYLTSDGGARWTDFSLLAAALDEHVQVVPAGSLPDLATAAAAVSGA